MVDPDLDRGKGGGREFFLERVFWGKDQSNVVYCLSLCHVSNAAPHVIIEVRMPKETGRCFLLKIRSKISGKWQKLVNGCFLQN